MAEQFFDESILQQATTPQHTGRDLTEFTYNIKKIDESYHLICMIGEERLNSSDLKSILKQHEQNPCLKPGDISILNYVSHRLGMVQTMYKLFNDLEMIFDYLKDSNFKCIFEGNQIKFSKDSYQLNFVFFCDEQSNIVLDFENDGEIIQGLEKIYFLQKNIMYQLSSQIPVKFYKELFNGNNKFSIETFLSLKNTLLEKLSLCHNVDFSDEVKNLDKLKKEEKIAPIVLEVGKTTHFVTLEFKYKVGDELFNISDYKYAETINWQDKKTDIKILKENDLLITYKADMAFTTDAFHELFQGVRLRISPSQKNPFSLMLPIATLDTIIQKVLPKAEQIYPIEYKDGNKLKLDNSNVVFELETKLERRINLFEFKVKFKVGDEYVDLDFLKDLMLKNKKYVQLKDGNTINIENIREINKWIEFLNNYEFKKQDNSYKASSEAALELDEFLRDFKDKNIKSNEEYKNLIQELKEKIPVEEIELPKEIQGTLRDYQKEGVFWMHFLRKYGFGGILADEMGLGKTVQTLATLALDLESTHIVVCPKTLIYNWESEVKKFFPNMTVLLVDGPAERRKQLIETIKNTKYNIIITSYSMLQKDYAEYISENLEFGYKVLDEAHYVKNMKTLSAKAVRLLPARNRILLTGTPLENNLEELYGTFDLIMPDYLGTKLDFRKDFISKIERNNMIALEILQAKIKPFILRRTKKEVLKELPEKQEQIVYNEMSNKQIGIYNEILQRVRAEALELIEKQGFDKSRIQILSALLKLRQVCNHPALVDKSFRGEQSISGKHEQFLELLEEVIEGGEKVLVFSQFTSMLDIFETDLKARGVKYERLDGSTKNRQDVVDRFNEKDEIKVFLISLKAGGVGLNLTSASSVFLYDPWWNPMAEKQAVDRAHRIGQTKNVNIYKFITRNSIEEKILKLQERKGNLFDNLVSEDKGFIKKLEWEDLMELFD